MNTPNYDVQRLNSIAITEVARRFGDQLKREGVTYKTLCPWHEDHHPSLSFDVRTGKNYCHCFSCNNGGDVIAYVMQHEQFDFLQACEWLSREFCITTTAIGGNILKPRRKTIIQPPELVNSYVPIEMVDQLVSTENSLCQCLMRMFQPEAVSWLTEEYRIGSCSMYGRDNWTVFPCIDRQGRVSNLKAQWYETDLSSENFGHCPKGHVYWLAKIWQQNGMLPTQGQYITSGLFGEHLLNKYPSNIVGLVESPKNALFGSLAFPQLVWVAVGNKGMLKREVMEPLRDRDVIVLPDCDAVEEWTAAISKMTDIANFTISDFCKRMAPADQPKFDIADYLQQHLKPF